MPETGSDLQQRSPPPVPGGSAAPLRLAPSSPCRHPAAGETSAGLLAHPHHRPPHLPGGAPVEPTPGSPEQGEGGRGRAIPAALRDTRRSQPAAPSQEPRGARGAGRGITWRHCRVARHRQTPMSRSPALRCRLTALWPQPRLAQPRRAVRAPVSPPSLRRGSCAPRPLAPALAHPPAGWTQRTAAGAGQRQPGRLRRPPVPGDARVARQPAADAAPGLGRSRITPFPPPRSPSGPAEKLQLVEIFVLGVWFGVFFILFFV